MECEGVNSPADIPKPKRVRSWGQRPRRMGICGKHVETHLRFRRNGAPVASGSDLDKPPLLASLLPCLFLSPHCSFWAHFPTEYWSQALLWENPTKIKPSGSHQTVGSSWATTGCVFGPKARPRAEEPPSSLPASAPSWKGVRT